ncbi:MAG TPA: class I SAM-dependent methyltransferase [Pyrinomonadaceae bacterium]|nr:class I SAM-dependent methyltransferase [Pyrinomonadaceae bacterium]
MSTATVQLERELAPHVGAIAEPRILGFSEQLQRDHYAEIAAEYEAHYSDAWSLAYRRQFIYQPMFEGLSLTGLKVLDAMCGSGQTTEYLIEKRAQVTGLDISDVVVDSFRERWSDCQAVCRSLLDSGVPDASFDCVVVIGGLHHIHPHLSLAVREIHRILKPGGFFCFMEPHSGSFPDLIRKFWYKHDRFFSENEAAIDLKSLEQEFGADFAFNRVEYSGNLAFLLVLNSLIFRIPERLKPRYSPALLKLESWIKKLQGKRTSCFVVGQWQKR